MKKLFSLISFLICAAMLMTTGFAATESDAYSLYKKAAKNLDAASSVEMTGISKTSMQLDGEDLGTITQNYLIKMLYTDGSGLQMDMLAKDSASGTTVDVYYKDGYMYMNVLGEKTKIKADADEAIPETGKFDTDLPASFFKDATTEKTADGTLIKMKIKISDLEKSSGISIEDEFSTLLPGADVKISTMNYSLLIGSDNEIKSYSMSFNMTIDYEGSTIKAKNNTKFKIISVNKINKIDFPSDLNTYKNA